MARKVIITCAVTGAIHTPSMSPHLPITPEEIAEAAIGAAEAGAAIVHLHARDPQNGKPDQSPEAFAPFLQDIKQRSNCVINITTGGAPTMLVEERVRPGGPLQAGGRLAQHGIDEFWSLPDAEPIQGVQESTGSRPTSKVSSDLVFRNTFTDIEYILTTARRTAPGSRSNAMISGIYIPGPLRRARPHQAASFRPDVLACSAAWVHIRRMWRT